jgi:hypothetical protein
MVYYLEKRKYFLLPILVIWKYTDNETGIYTGRYRYSVYSLPCTAFFFLIAHVRQKHSVTDVTYREMVRELCRKITKEQAKLEIQQCYQHGNLWTITFHLSNQRPYWLWSPRNVSSGYCFLAQGKMASS